MNQKSKSRFALASICGAVVLFGGLQARAANSVWTATTDGAFNVPGNWSNGVPGSTTSSANADVATFNTATGVNVTVDNPRYLGGFTFDAGVGSFNFNSGGLFLHGGGAIQLASTVTSSGQTETIGTLISISGAYSFTNNATTSDVLSFSSAATITNSTVATLTLNGTNTGNNLVSGVISDGTGAMSVTKSGAGVWTLAGNNTYSGTTTVSVGTLNINASGTGTTNSAIGTGALVISPGAAVDNTSGAAVTLQTSNAASFSTFTFGGSNNLAFGSGAASNTSNASVVTLNGTNKTLAFGGAVTNTNSGSNIGLTVNGAGNTLSFGGYNIGNAGTGKNLAISGTGNVTINGAVADNSTTASTLTYSGSGVLTLAGTGTGASTYTGTTSVTSGTLLINGTKSGVGTVSIGSNTNGGATLGGTGSLAGVTSVAGTSTARGVIAPGTPTSTGVLTLTSSVALGTSGSSFTALAVTLNGTTLGTQYSELVANGVTITGNSQLLLTIGFTPTVGQTFEVISNTGGSAISGTFSNAANNGVLTANGVSFTANYAGGDGNDLVLSVTAVPEPATTGMLIGLALLAFAARRIRRSAPTPEV